MEYKSVNPYTGEVFGNYNGHSKNEIKQMLKLSEEVFKQWKLVPINERSRLMQKAAEVLEEGKQAYAEMITKEMGKPIKESRAEVEKCAWVCRYYAENTERFLKDEYIATEASESFVRHEPLGSILAIMPWNFPFWQVFRFAAPSLMAGNAAILKHASNVPGCANQIEEVFKKAGFPEGLFQNVYAGHEVVEELIGNRAIKAVTLTGSEKAGSTVASIAGKYLKKSLLELGGSNAFIVFDDANIREAVEVGVKARMLNTGQSCIAAKRFIVVERVYEEFVKNYVEEVKGLKQGNPMEEDTKLGPLSKPEFAEKLNRQVENSVAMGVEVLTGGNFSGAMYEPTVLVGVKPGMPVFDEETFGPVAAIIKARDEKEAFELANLSPFGLGVSLFTEDIEKAQKWIGSVDDGCFFINGLVKSDPRLPFGGTKNSGYGRELGKDGLLEFVNRKTVYIE
jgi:succinate-semialdehyde dehydrogenase / glutarate-semialdehyde dehydrogenase